MSGTDVVLALDAYSLGEAAGRVALATVGAALVQAGLRRRARERVPVAPAPVPSSAADDRWAWMNAPAPAAAVASVPSAPAADGTGAAAPAGFDFFAAPSTPPAAPASWPPVSTVPAPVPAGGRSGVPLLVAGSLLFALALLSFVLRWTPLGDARVELPSQVLGMQKDDAATAMSQDVMDAMSRHVPGGMPDFEVAVYGTLPSGLMVMAADEGSRAPAAELQSFRAGMATQLAIDEGTDIRPGERAGAARCWNGQQQGRSAVVCAFVDRETSVIVIDFTGNDLATASRAASSVRAAVVG